MLREIDNSRSRRVNGLVFIAIGALLLAIAAYMLYLSGRTTTLALQHTPLGHTNLALRYGWHDLITVGQQHLENVTDVHIVQGRYRTRTSTLDCWLVEFVPADGTAIRLQCSRDKRVAESITGQVVTFLHDTSVGSRQVQMPSDSDTHSWLTAVPVALLSAVGLLMIYQGLFSPPE